MDTLCAKCSLSLSLQCQKKSLPEAEMVAQILVYSYWGWNSASLIWISSSLYHFQEWLHHFHGREIGIGYVLWPHYFVCLCPSLSLVFDSRLLTYIIINYILHQLINCGLGSLIRDLPYELKSFLILLIKKLTVKC